MTDISEKNDSQIDNVKEFARSVFTSNTFWSLLIGKKVARLNRGVEYKIIQSSNHEEAIKHLEFGIVHSITRQHKKQILIIEVDYGNEVCAKYTREQFIEQFDVISPPIPFQKIIELEQRHWRTDKKSALEEFIQKREETREEARLESERQKQSLIEYLAIFFQEDFLSVDLFYRNDCDQYLSNDEYQAKKTYYVQSWLEKNLSLKSDPEQAAAIGAVEGHVQVVARAGSGKTRTLVSRALFLQKHCGVSPHEMLLLAFNKKAANEIHDRLMEKSQDSIPHVMTFHALAYALVHPEESILYNEPDGEQSKSRALQTVIDDYLRDPYYWGKIRDLMTMHFREDWENIILGGYDKIPEELLEYRRSLPKESLRGEYVKSFGEKTIANFLFEHNINYKYEHSFWWDGINYRPDFTIFTGDKQGIIIEYFGLKDDPDYDEMSDRKRQYWKNRDEWQLLEFYPRDLKKDGIEGFYALLKNSLEKHQIPCNRLSEAEIWLRIKDRAIDRFTKAMENFIQRCRKLILSLEELAEIIAKHICVNKVEQRFLELAEIFYEAYLERLQATGEEDFDGLMQRASEVVTSGCTIFRRKSGSGDLKKIRYIFIDEYQDFSKLFHCLIEAIRMQNSDVQLFCVGDDWQAINGFAGSDLSFYQNFETFFQPSQKLTISTNYRSRASIVNVSNQLMAGLGIPARENHKLLGRVEIAYLSNFEPSPIEQQDHPGDCFTPAILRLLNRALQDNKSVVLLSRKHSLPWPINYGENRNKGQNQLDNFLEMLRSKFPEPLREKINISTTHKYKGLEKEVVIILDAIFTSYPLLHPDLMFTFALGSSIEGTVEEERRLFYVALTRAVEHLVILTEKDNMSPFVEDLQSRLDIPLLKWPTCPPIVGESTRITVRITNQSGKGSNGTFTIKEQLKAEGYKWDSLLKAWWRNYSAQDFSVQAFFANTQWVSYANGIQLQFCDDLENVLDSYAIDEGQYTCISDNFSRE